MNRRQRDQRDAYMANERRLMALDVTRDADLERLMAELKAARLATKEASARTDDADWSAVSAAESLEEQALEAYNVRANAYKSIEVAK